MTIRHSEPGFLAQEMRAELTNAEIAELLALESQSSRPPAQRALRRASRRAFLWDEEAVALIRSRRPLAELPGVGPYIARLIREWIKNPPKMSPPPSIRSGFLTMTDARLALATKNDWLSNIKGDLQMHSDWSDGSSTIAEMAAAALERHYEYIAITDHAKGLKIAGGIDEEQLARQGVEIEKLNASIASGNRFRVLRSIELNLNPKGEGDMSPESLARLDIVLGCFHSSLRKSEDQTGRYLSALRNPTIQILGHPRGRIYNFRAGLSADWPRVLGEAAKLDKTVEIDGYPDRQDLSPDLVRQAAKEGCRISLGTDSHGPSQLRFMEFSAASTLLAGVKRERILNFMPADDLLEWVAKLRDYGKLRNRAARVYSTKSQLGKHSLRIP